MVTAGGFTKLSLAKNLTNSFRRTSAILNANVALATHGETVSEVLGSGNGSQPYQRFALRQAPLTYVSAQTPTGAETTLQLRVNDVLWHQASTLFGLGPRDRVYTTRAGDDGKVTVLFGDGATGARLPSGTENVARDLSQGDRQGRQRQGRPTQPADEPAPGAAGGGQPGPGRPAAMTPNRATGRGPTHRSPC